MGPAKAAAKRDAEATKKAILDAAESLFLDRGFGDVSMGEIAETADVTKSLIHHHFGSKQDLWTAVKERRFEAYADRQEEMLEGAPDPSAKLLRDSLETYYRFHQANPDMTRMVAWAAMEQDPHVKPRETALCALGASKIQQAQEAGYLRVDVDPRLVLSVFWALVEHHFLFRERHAEGLGLQHMAPAEIDEKYLDTILKIFMEGMLPR